MSSIKDVRLKVARRLRRKRHIRARMSGTGERPRLTVFRSHRNISCQLIDDDRRVTLASASTLDKEIAGSLEGARGNCTAAVVIGKSIAEKAKTLGIQAAQFDRNGYKFHGSIKALVDAAREAGLKC